MELNKTSPIPLSYQLAGAIREQIASGELKPGDQIPTERDLTETACQFYIDDSMLENGCICDLLSAA